ncbi:hypothetical protein BC628DRAFT_195398 [Trametes gibbosa]|nr:hypothetical protein BC628DRAFT_195398 [Trametes gibbosa]
MERLKDAAERHTQEAASALPFPDVTELVRPRLSSSPDTQPSVRPLQASSCRSRTHSVQGHASGPSATPRGIGPRSLWPQHSPQVPRPESRASPRQLELGGTGRGQSPTTAATTLPPRPHLSHWPNTLPKTLTHRPPPFGVGQELL